MLKCPDPNITCILVMFNSIINDTKVTNVNFHLIAHSAVGHSTQEATWVVMTINVGQQ